MNLFIGLLLVVVMIIVTAEAKQCRRRVNEQVRLENECPDDYKRIISFYTIEGRELYKQAHARDEGVCKIQEITIRNENLLIVHYSTRVSFIRELRRLRSLIRTQDNMSGIIKNFEPNQIYRPVNQKNSYASSS
mmetsp:Transcript_6704/g.9737  ORF Transcript_6704/g.9737 Transcript_6704/m.9737 type:complete len:134 (+) Transcript_6704:473-874(+)